MPETSALAKRVREYRKSQKKSQFELSEEIGISLEELSLIERERANPNLSTMQKIAAHMDMSVSELLEVKK